MGGLLNPQLPDRVQDVDLHGAAGALGVPLGKEFHDQPVVGHRVLDRLPALGRKRHPLEMAW